MDRETETKLWKQHAAVAAAREKFRKEAETHEAKRKNAWREYYKLTNRLKEIETELDFDPLMFTDYADEPPSSPPGAPRKKRAIDLTK